jgi:hypothetical protein
LISKRPLSKIGGQNIKARFLKQFILVLSEIFKMEKAKEKMKGEPKEDINQEKKDNSKKEEKIIKIFIGILILIFAGFLIGNNLLKEKNYFEYQGFTVYKQPLEGTQRIYYAVPFTFQIGSKEYKDTTFLKIDPRTLENISVNINNEFFSSRNQIIMLFDPKAPARIIESMFEIKRLAKILSIPLDVAVTYETNTSTQQVMGCNESSLEQRIIYFDGNATETIVFEDNCLHIDGTDYDEIDRATDAFIWQWISAIALDKK